MRKSTFFPEEEGRSDPKVAKKGRPGGKSSTKTAKGRATKGNGGNGTGKNREEGQRKTGEKGRSATVEKKGRGGVRYKGKRGDKGKTERQPPPTTGDVHRPPQRKEEWGKEASPSPKNRKRCVSYVTGNVVRNEGNRGPKRVTGGREASEVGWDNGPKKVSEIRRGVTDDHFVIFCHSSFVVLF